jgi:hypothetical protein
MTEIKSLNMKEEKINAMVGGEAKTIFRNYGQDNRQNWSQDYRLDNETRCKMCNAWNHTAPNYP